MVALRKESVDRNITNELLTALKTVALRKESVDRNIFCCHLLNIPADVALRKESVDRNSAWGRRGTGAGCSRSPQGERG